MRSLPQINGVLFDMGDILYDATGWRRWLAKHLSDLGETIEYMKLVPLWEDKLVEVYLGKKPYWSAFEELMASFGFDNSTIEKTKKTAKAKGQLFSDGHTTYEGVKEGLERLYKANITLGVLSDTESTGSHVRDKLVKFGINEYFHAVITSFDIKAVKPQPESFQYGINSLGKKKAEVAFVGHDRDELEGALDFGLFTIANNCHEDIPCNIYTRSFGEVVDAILSVPDSTSRTTLVKC